MSASPYEFDPVWFDRLDRSPMTMDDVYLGLSGPHGIVTVEKLRRLARLEDFADQAVGVDVFAFALGEPADRSVTKIGGAPYRPRDLPWPETDAGPMTFVCQYRFTESRDLVGDVLLIFAREYGLYTGEPDQPYFRFEWQPLGLTDLIEPQAVPKPAWEFLHAYGVRFRSVDYAASAEIDQRCEETLRSLPPDKYGHANPHWMAPEVSCYSLLKIGGTSRWFRSFFKQPVDLPGRPLCMLPQVCAGCELEWPWLNVQRPISLDEALREWPKQALCWGDGHNIYFTIDDADEIHWTVEF